MLRLDLPVGLLLLSGLLQGRQLTFGEDQALLGHPGFGSLCWDPEPLLEGLQVVAQPYRRTPHRDMMTPCLRSSLAARSWP